MCSTILPSGIALHTYKKTSAKDQHHVKRNKHLYLDFGWTNLTFKTHANIENHYLSIDQVHLVLDGYISSENNTLEKIIHAFKNHGAAAIAKLQGSFALCFIDTSEKSITFFTDKTNSRSYYISNTENDIQIATRVDFLAHRANCKGSIDINQQAVIQYLIRGAFYADHTLFKNITKIKTATELTIRQGLISKKEYWMLEFKPSSSNSPQNEQDLIDEGHQLIKNALEKSISSFSTPLLFLSGGTDSRIILGMLSDIGYIKKTHAITWGVQPIQAGDDMDTAIKLAEKARINHQIFNIETSNFQQFIHQAIAAVDCRVDILDAPALAPLWQSLAHKYDCFINGDEWFGWQDKVYSTKEAMDIAGWWGLDQVARIADWIRPEQRKKINNSIENTLKEISNRTQTEDPNNIKDAVYYYERMGNMLNAQLASRLPYLQPLRPLLNEEVTEFVSRIPVKYRYDKRLLRLILQQKYPELDALPYASKKALPTAKRLQEVSYQNQTLQLFLQTELFQNQNKLLADIIDFKVLESVYQTFFTGSPLPPVKSSLIQNIPLMWRYLPKPENRVPPITGIYRVLALNIYLNQIVSH